MRIVLLTLLGALVLTAAVGTDARADDKAEVEKELKKFQGAWTFYSVKSGDQVVEAATLKLDPSKTPKTFDSTVTAGPNKGKVYLAIYEISGDTLKVCYDEEGKKRPTEFKGETGAQTLVVHKRVKK
jgi:uncharacterized protein (TIGR03067 family)